MSFPIRTKENTPFSVASNTPRPMPPMRDLTAGEWYAIDPKAFEAAIIMMNISAEDKKFGKTHDDDLEGMSLNTVLRPVGHSVATEDTGDNVSPSKYSALVHLEVHIDPHIFYALRRSTDVSPHQSAGIESSKGHLSGVMRALEAASNDFDQEIGLTKWGHRRSNSHSRGWGADHH